jgi:putative acetyltransferase
MNKLSRTNSADPDFIELVRLLDLELAARDGEEHAFYAQYSTIDTIQHALVLYNDAQPVACGALRKYDDQAVEVKRMYTLPEVRGQGHAASVLQALEDWARALGFKKCILETGTRQPEAIALYEKSGYSRIPNYGQYDGVENSLCFGKQLVLDN